jgi:anti-sigma regulatory factor (Ser/Thr protein kinase)
MTGVVLLLMQSPSVSIPLGAVVLVMVGLLLLAAILGGLLVLRARPAAMSSPQLAKVLNALPFPAVFVSSDDVPLVVNTKANAWLEADSPPRLLSPLRTLVRRVASSREAETVRIMLGEGQPSLRIHASPLLGDSHNRADTSPPTGFMHLGDNAHPGGTGLHGVLLLAPPGGNQPSPDLTRLVAHELRTPLTAIVGHAEILESCGPSDEALWRRSRDFIAAETQHLAFLVDDLLALSRLEASLPLMRTVNPRTVVESALSRVFDRGEDAGLNLNLDAPPSLPRVHVDPDRLEQAFVNLLDNAIKYTPAGGTVVARLTFEGGYVCVEISDTGPGIAPEDLPHLFEPLYRAESVRDLPGTGLGLTIVRIILDQHGVPISVRSVPDEGTTFTFRLPVAW